MQHISARRHGTITKRAGRCITMRSNGDATWMYVAILNSVQVLVRPACTSANALGS